MLDGEREAPRHMLSPINNVNVDIPIWISTCLGSPTMSKLRSREAATINLESRSDDHQARSEAAGRVEVSEAPLGRGTAKHAVRAIQYYDKTPGRLIVCVRAKAVI